MPSFVSAGETCRRQSWGEKLGERSEEVPLDRGRGVHAGCSSKRNVSERKQKELEFFFLPPPRPPPVNSSVLNSFSNLQLQIYMYPGLM